MQQLLTESKRGETGRNRFSTAKPELEKIVRSSNKKKREKSSERKKRRARKHYFDRIKKQKETGVMFLLSSTDEETAEFLINARRSFPKMTSKQILEAHNGHFPEKSIGFGSIGKFFQNFVVANPECKLKYRCAFRMPASRKKFLVGLLRSDKSAKRIIELFRERYPEHTVSSVRAHIVKLYKKDSSLREFRRAVLRGLLKKHVKFISDTLSTTYVMGETFMKNFMKRYGKFGCLYNTLHLKVFKVAVQKKLKFGKNQLFDNMPLSRISNVLNRAKRLKIIKGRKYDILYLRLVERMSTVEIGKKFGVTRECIQQIEKRYSRSILFLIKNPRGEHKIKALLVKFIKKWKHAGVYRCLKAFERKYPKYCKPLAHITYKLLKKKHPRVVSKLEYYW